MPTRTFVKDPETGKPAVAVTNFQVVELTDLETEVANQTTARDAKSTEVENLRTQLEVAEAELNAQEVALSEAKSELEDAQGVVAEPTDGVDAGADAPSGENPASETPAEATADPAESTEPVENLF